MGIPDGGHTHGHDGGGAGEAVFLDAKLTVKLAGPVVAAVGELLDVVAIVAGVILGLGAVGLVALLVFRARRTLALAARADSPVPGTLYPFRGGRGPPSRSRRRSGPRSSTLPKSTCICGRVS
jgi:hypothetical protein